MHKGDEVGVIPSDIFYKSKFMRNLFKTSNYSHVYLFIGHISCICTFNPKTNTEVNLNVSMYSIIIIQLNIS